MRCLVLLLVSCLIVPFSMAQKNTLFPGINWRTSDSLLASDEVIKVTTACCAKPHGPMGHGPLFFDHITLAQPPPPIEEHPLLEYRWRTVEPIHIDTAAQLVNRGVKAGKSVWLLEEWMVFEDTLSKEQAAWDSTLTQAMGWPGQWPTGKPEPGVRMLWLRQRAGPDKSSPELIRALASIKANTNKQWGHYRDEKVPQPPQYSWFTFRGVTHYLIVH